MGDREEARGVRYDGCTGALAVSPADAGDRLGALPPDPRGIEPKMKGMFVLCCQPFGAHFQEFLAPGFAHGIAFGFLDQLGQFFFQGLADVFDYLIAPALGAACGFRDDPVYGAQLAQVLGGDAHGFGSFAHLFTVFPQDGCAALGADHRIDRVFKHHYRIGGGQGHGTAGATFANNQRDQRAFQRKAFFRGPRDGLALPALFGALSGIGSGGVHQVITGRAKRSARSISRIALR